MGFIALMSRGSWFRQSLIGAFFNRDHRGGLRVLTENRYSRVHLSSKFVIRAIFSEASSKDLECTSIIYSHFKSHYTFTKTRVRLSKTSFFSNRPYLRKKKSPCIKYFFKHDPAVYLYSAHTWSLKHPS